VAVGLAQAATWSWASGITQRWILETSPVFMAFMNPTATSLSVCPEKGPPMS
jgi:hypothetical protein